MPFLTPRDRRFLRLMVLEVLHKPAPSFWPALSGLAAVLFALASLANRTQQFQKNAYHFDKHLISEPASSCSSTASMTHTCHIQMITEQVKRTQQFQKKYVSF
jgi:hypothetical protein